jgi:hypothetical protein
MLAIIHLAFFLFDNLIPEISQKNISGFSCASAAVHYPKKDVLPNTSVGAYPVSALAARLNLSSYEFYHTFNLHVCFTIVKHKINYFSDFFSALTVCVLNQSRKASVE